jgi:hypothetical protein
MPSILRTKRIDQSIERLVYVSKTGNDTSGTGDASSPVASLSKAKALVRIHLSNQRKGLTRSCPIRVLFGDGTYFQPSTEVFDWLDSGLSLINTVTYCALNPGKVVISGGIPLTYSTTTSGKLRYTAPSATLTDIIGGGQLYVNGTRATLARMPKKGSFYFVRKSPYTLGETKAQTTQFVPEPVAAELYSTLSGPVTDTTSDLYRVIVNVLYSWTSYKVRISTAAATVTSGVRITPPVQQSFLSAGADQRFYFENVPSFQTDQGEWVQNAGFIDYIPKPGEGPTSIAILAALDTILSFSGDTSRKNYVQNISFEGISFQHQRSIIPLAGYVDIQAATGDAAGAPVGAAIILSGAKNVNFDYCEVKHTGGYGIWKKTEVQKCRTSKCVFHDLGAGAERIGETVLSSVSDPYVVSANTFTNSIVHGTGKVFPGAVGVLIQKSLFNEISHNLLCDTSYSAISIGWSWGYSSTTSACNYIANNLIYNVANKQMSDGAGIYSLGLSPGTQVYRNVVCEVRDYPYFGPQPGGWGLYLDEGSSFMQWRENVVIGTDAPSMFMHYGANNSLKRNILLGSASAFQLAKSQEITPFRTITSHGVYSAGIAVVSATWQNGFVVATLASPHGKTTGSRVTIQGSTPSGYNTIGALVCSENHNGTVTGATSPGSVTLIYPCATDPGTYVSGSGIPAQQILNSSANNLRIQDKAVIANHNPPEVNGTFTVNDVTQDSFTVSMASAPTSFVSSGTINKTSHLTFDGNYAIPSSVTPLVGYVDSTYVDYTNNLVSTSVAGASINISAAGTGAALSTGTYTQTSDPKNITLIGAPSQVGALLSDILENVGPDESGIPSEFLAEVPRTLVTTYPAPPRAPEFDVTVDLTDVTVLPSDFKYFASTVNGTPKVGSFTVSTVTPPPAIVPSGKVLTVYDDASYSTTYEPYMQITGLNRTSGKMVVRYAIMVDANSRFEVHLRNKQIGSVYANFATVMFNGSLSTINPGTVVLNSTSAVFTNLSISDNVWYFVELTISDIHLNATYAITIKNSTGTIIYTNQNVPTCNIGADILDGVYFISVTTGVPTSTGLSEMSIQRT